MKPTLINAVVIKKTQLSPKVVNIDFKPLNISYFEFIPGQFISLKVSSEKFRSYSISSDPYQHELISITVTCKHEGPGANYVRSLNEGDEVTFIGPAGRYNLKKPLPKSLKFLAVGTGITPFIPMFQQLLEENYTGDIKLFLGFRHIEDIFWEDKLKYFSDSKLNFEYKIFISQPENNSVEAKKVNSIVQDEIDDVSQYYICGNPDMVKEVVSILENKNVSKDRIIYEEYVRH